MKTYNYAVVLGAGSALLASLLVTPVFSADENPFKDQQIQQPAGSTMKLAQGMTGRCGGGMMQGDRGKMMQGRCGGSMMQGGRGKMMQGRCGGSMMQGRCGSMMGGMMGGAMPRATGPAEMPDADSAGAKLVSRYCTQCHDLPSPKLHSASGWPTTVVRMNERMQWLSQNGNSTTIVAPSADELSTLIGYLAANGVESDAASPAQSGPVGASGMSQAKPTATEILRERYARGEIDRAEYLQHLEDLSK